MRRNLTLNLVHFQFIKMTPYYYQILLSSNVWTASQFQLPLKNNRLYDAHLTKFNINSNNKSKVHLRFPFSNSYFFFKFGCDDDVYDMNNRLKVNHFIYWSVSVRDHHFEQKNVSHNIRKQRTICLQKNWYELCAVECILTGVWLKLYGIRLEFCKKKRFF